MSKSFEFGKFRVNPKLDLFNALNSDDYTSVTSTQFGGITSQVNYGREVQYTLRLHF